MSDVLRRATPLPLDPPLVRSCLDQASPLDVAFWHAANRGLATLPPGTHRGRLNGVTGHIGESVAELLLVGLGWHPLWHFPGPGSGGHGVDLLMLTPQDTVVAVEVKATLVPRRWPRPTTRELTQLSPAWLDSADNPGMANVGVTGADVHGLIMVLNFADAAWKAAITHDFTSIRPAACADDLQDAAWLTINS